MIDKISDVRIQQTSLEETTQASEAPAQDNITSEAEPVVTATPEYKSGMIAEQQMGGQAQEMLLRNQLDSQIPVQNDTERKPISFTRDNAPRETPKSAKEVVSDTLKQVPDQLKRTLGEIGEAWSHPGDVLSAAAEEAKRKLDDIKAGR